VQSRALLQLVRRLTFALGFMLLGGLIAGVAVYGMYLARQPPLHIWHRAALDGEFRAGAEADLDGYRRREDRLFAELHEEVHARLASDEQRLINRFAAASPLNPDNHARNWNRTFELPSPAPSAGVLLLHGLSDSPYSLRALGERLNAAGAWVVGLRLPGHGTAPSGLLDASWQDWTAAVRLAARHLVERVGSDRPLLLVGYSNGAALALELAVAAGEGEAGVPQVDGLILLSPAIRVTPAAALAGWQAALARGIGLETLAWSDIQPEFDPYKYNSFTLNAAEQIHRLTLSVAERLDRLAVRGGGKVDLPPVLAFQSVVDATIPAAAVVDGLFLRLAPGPHALVLFDVNRYTEARALMIDHPEALTGRLLSGPPPGFAVTVVTNAAEDSRAVVARTRPSDGNEMREAPLGLGWPPGMFSLSHIALPFPSEDRIYGAGQATGTGKGVITLGSITLLGERGILQIPDGFFLRLRYNPFFPYLAQRAEAFLHGIVTRGSSNARPPPP
jgi:alpha-beta hydrolase superfamily lysophospholipase